MLRFFAIFYMMWITSGQDTITFGPYSYSINHMPFEFSAAETTCAAMNATLAVIDNETLYRQLVDFIENSQSSLRAYWIGLRRIRDTNDFMWDDGTQLLPDSFNAWDDNEPFNSNGNEDCVIMGHPCCGPNVSMYRWFDVGCTPNAFRSQVAPGFICQSLPGNVTISTTTTASTERTITGTTESKNSEATFSVISTASRLITISSTTTSTNGSITSIQLPLEIVLPVVIVAFLAILVLLIIMICYRKKLFQSSKLQAQRANGNGAARGGLEAATYEAVSPEINETNFYEIPLPPNGEKTEKGRGSYYSHHSRDSLEDDFAADEGAINNEQREIEEDTYCSVGEFNIEAIPEEYVPFEALESKEDHTYSVPDPFKPVSPPDQDVYDALACTS